MWSKLQELQIFMKQNFKMNLKHRSLTTCYEKQHYFKKDLCWSWLRTKRNNLETSAAPSNVNKILLSTCFAPGIYHDLGNLEINKFDFLLAKEILINFSCSILLLATVTYVINAHPTILLCNFLGNIFKRSIFNNLLVTGCQKICFTLIFNSFLQKQRHDTKICKHNFILFTNKFFQKHEELIGSFINSSIIS